MKHTKIIIAALCIIALNTACSTKTNFSLDSPNAKLVANVNLTPVGQLSYNAIFNGEEIINNSLLGIVVNGDSLYNNLEILDVAFNSVDQEWQMPWGQNKNIVDNHNAILVKLKHKPSGTFLNVEFKAFDDALAFRYILPHQMKEAVVQDELSQIVVADNPEIWWSYADFNTYEKTFMHTKLDSASWVATPAIMRRADSIHIALGEAAVMNFPDMTLKNLGNGVLKVELTPLRNGNKAVINAPFESPWRTINVGENAGDIIEASTALNLSPKQAVGHVQNYKPMTYIGVWWDFHLGTKEWKEGPRQGATTKSAMKYIDFAAKHNIGGVVVEGWNTGWNTWGIKNDFDQVTPAKNYDLRKVAAYAKENGVRLIMHHETGADVTKYEMQMDSAFKLCQELGITDVKTGHAGMVTIDQNHHSQPMVEHFERIAQKAAEYGIALNMHEPIKASGIERTYPNLMTREAVRGMEWEAWSEGNPPSHTVTIPFTRGLAGATDYTPGIFDILYQKAKNERKAWNSLTKDMDAHRVHSTLAHQLSLMVTIYSPWVMASDRVESYENHPAFTFVEQFNPDFDQTKVLDAKIGEYIATARRTGDTWYVGATTNEEGRTLNLPMDFLEEGKDYTATIYIDGDDADWVSNPTDYKIVTQNITNKDALTLKLANGGGAAIVIK